MPHTLVVADTHTHWKPFLSFLWTHRPSVCLVAGDFGWWPGHELSLFLRLKPETSEIRFIDGNHEDHSSLFAAVKRRQDDGGYRSHEPVELAPGLWYQPRGSTYTLADGRTIFCVGGAAPVKNATVLYERPAMLDRTDLPASLPSADIVLAHTLCNRSGLLATLPPLKGQDPSTFVLDEVFSAVRPKLWLCGHLHRHMRSRAEGCVFHVLDLLMREISRPLGTYAYVLVD
ncbi:MAG: metallophosphoesterase [Desulfovibrionaceae bacterium]|nr:metallophosphoesterase [Desulfovibrionaceae bacterium]